MSSEEEIGPLPPPPLPPPPPGGFVVRLDPTGESSATPSPPTPPTFHPHLMVESPPGPSHHHRGNTDEDGIDTFVYDGSSDDGDDSDIEGDHGGSMSPSYSTLTTPTNATTPTASSTRRKHLPASPGKLSFTAPSQPSPLDIPGTGAPDQILNPNGGGLINTRSSIITGGSMSAPTPPSSDVAGVSLSALSTQMSLHMELQTFAAQRRQSIVQSGGNAAQLIPIAAATAPTTPTAASSSDIPGPVTANPPRRTQNIRAMSMTLATLTAGHHALLPPSVLASASEARKRTARTRRSRRETVDLSPRGDERVLDLFGDGLVTDLPLVATAVIVTATSPTSASSAAARAKRVSVCDLPPIMEAATPAAPLGVLNLGSVFEEDDPSTILAPGQARASTSTATTATSSAAASAASSQRSSFASPSTAQSRRSSMASPTKSSSPSASPDLGDDVTVALRADATGVAAVFPFRRAVRAPLHHASCLEAPAADASPSALAQQERMLLVLLEALRSRREALDPLTQDLASENTALRELLDREQARGTELTRRDSKPVSEVLRASAARKALKLLARHAKWNTTLHTVNTRTQLELEDMKRRVQLHQGSTSVGGGDDEHASPLAVVIGLGGGQRPAVSLVEVASKAGAGARGHDLLSSPSFSGHPGHPSRSMVHSSQQVARFSVTKINRIRKNTPRLLEIDVQTHTMTICKKDSSSSSSAASSPDADDEFSNRDIVLAPGSIVASATHPHPKKDTQFELAFLLPQSTDKTMMGHGSFSTPSSSGSGSNLLSPSLSKSPSAPSPSQLAKDKVKHWKILFTDRAERERFYRLLSSTLLESPSPLLSPSSSSPFTPASPGDFPGSPTSGGGNGGARSTHYPHPQSNGVTVTATYTPHVPALTPSVLAQVRLLPLLPLASSLHTSWCLAKSGCGFKYGLKLTANTHPLLVPFHALPLARRDYNLRAVTATLAAVMQVGFVVRRPLVTADDTVLDALASKPLGSHTPGAGSAPATSLLASAIAPSPGSVQLCPDLLSPSVLDFLGECAHDLWAEDKLAAGWCFGRCVDVSSKRHAGLVPFHVLDTLHQAGPRNRALKVISTLAEWGYEVRREAQTPTASVSPTPQPAMGSLRRPASTPASGGTLAALTSAGSIHSSSLTASLTSRLMTSSTFAPL